MIGSQEYPETLIRDKPKTFLSQKITNENRKGSEIFKKTKFESPENLIRAFKDKSEDSEATYEIDFEDSTIHDEKFDVAELKRKYGY